MHICYNSRAFVDLVSNILIISQSSLSLFLGCVRPQFAANSPNTIQSPPPQFITIHDIPITKSTKNKGKSNQKSIQTQNQTFNGKLNNLEPKIKLSTKKPINPNPNSNRSHRHHCHGELAAFFACGELAAAIREERNKCLRATTKEKIKK